MGLNLITPPAAEPVSVAELKEFLRVDADDTSQDGVIAALGMAARSWAEIFTGRRFVMQTWRLLLDFFPGYIDTKLGNGRGFTPFASGTTALLSGIRYAIVLPSPPVRSIVALQFNAADGSMVTMDPSTYVRDLQSNPARLTPVFGQMWPVARVQVNAVQVDYSTGYAQPLTLVGEISPPDGYGVVASDYTFQASDIGRPISIQGAGPNGGTLNTVIASISSPPDTTARLRDPITMSILNAPALLMNAAYGNPAHWEMIKLAIKMLVARWYEIRVPDESKIPMAVQNCLWPIRDIRL